MPKEWADNILPALLMNKPKKWYSAKEIQVTSNETEAATDRVQQSPCERVATKWHNVKYSTTSYVSSMFSCVCSKWKKQSGCFSG